MDHGRGHVNVGDCDRWTSHPPVQVTELVLVLLLTHLTDLPPD